jgi:hypothetical protein
LFDSERPNGPAPTDLIRTARIEAVKQLAQGLSDRVAVMERSSNVVHANEAAWAETITRQRHAKCYEAFAHRTDPCGTVRRDHRTSGSRDRLADRGGGSMSRNRLQAIIN